MHTHALRLVLAGLALACATPAAVFAADPAPAAPAADAKAYPLTTCVVSGEALDSMGGAYDYVHKEAGKPDRLVKLCCSGCVRTFKKDPAKYLARLDAAQAEAAKPDAPGDAHAGHAH